MNDEDLQLIPHTRAADLLAAAAEAGRPAVPEEALRTVLALLELSGARMHDGYPELSSALLEQLLYERLYLYVQPDLSARADGAQGYGAQAYGDAVLALIEHQRAARRLNAKRYERLREEAEWQGEVLGGLLRRSDLVTWPRLYALLLRADGVDTADPGAVRGWLDAFRELTAEQRLAVYAAAPGLEPEERDGGWGPTRLLMIGMATDGARLLLEQGLMQRSYRNLAELTALGRPMPEELAGDFDGFEAAVAVEALRLYGEWTVPGLPALLVEEYPDLAPEPGNEEIEEYLAAREAAAQETAQEAADADGEGDAGQWPTG
ncbi:hypothetical protein AB0D08_04665 [Kitasatospora sp. NPDC048540]|uniref:hypothetical protein n=1 Tax=Kitasatospora sp. NPDC048540 TaxID=3155634 RepID=UPI0033E43066